MRPVALVAAAVLLGLAVPQGPALAAAADPSRSQASAHAPALAPGVWGAAPVHGSLAGDGRLSLWVPVSGIQTGYSLYDALLRQSLGPALTLRTGPALAAGGPSRLRRVRVDAVVSAGAAVAELPLTLRLRQAPGGTSLATYFSVALAPYGVVHPFGQDPGRVQVAVYAFFPGR